MEKKTEAINAYLISNNKGGGGGGISKKENVSLEQAVGKSRGLDRTEQV